MRHLTAKADIKLLRQQTQYTCTATSLCAAYKALGKDLSEEDVNRVLGAEPYQGASWEQMLATTQYFGMRGILVVPATIQMLKSWTDKGLPVVIAWNPEKRPWSHASVVFDVLEDGTVYVMDPNIPNPNETVRIVPQNEFYGLWAEKWSEQLIVRRPAMAIELEVTPEGRQVRASAKMPYSSDLVRKWGQLQNLPAMPHPSALPEPNLIQPSRQEGSPDPDAPGSFWWTEEIPAIVWRNHYFQTRFVMSTRDKDHFILVPSDLVGQWGSSGYQVVSQPQVPKLAAAWGETMAR